ncbi:hypothetical protein O181_031835 [Austropuccinia psidii MF-1]|uniref:Uncharacterized protein n=1 Tax=Austropuccinia psidii MF-1 TaxID=1389203 RepID=A0A9Q3CYP0_9BASI|nr:hypothetical protein [Austropuccinia psidii MF-1]
MCDQPSITGRAMAAGTWQAPGSELDQEWQALDSPHFALQPFTCDRFQYKPKSIHDETRILELGCLIACLAPLAAI